MSGQKSEKSERMGTKTAYDVNDLLSFEHGMKESHWWEIGDEMTSRK